MQGKTKERWLELCEQAAAEQDHKKLMLLVAEINRLLEEKQHRVLSTEVTQKGSSPSGPG